MGKGAKVRTGVLMCSGRGGFVRVRFEPRWADGGEVPLQEVKCLEGKCRWYGSGTWEAVFDKPEIVVRLPLVVRGGVVVFGVPQSHREALRMALRKVVQPDATAAVGGVTVPEDVTWPNLWEYVSKTAYPDGSPREPSALIIVGGMDGWRGCVSDKDNQRTLWKSAATLDDLLLTLEEALAADDAASWRQAASAKAKGKKRG